MRAIYAFVTTVLLLGSLGSLSDILAEGSNDGRPASGRNNVWYAHDDTADTVIVFVHGFISDSRDAWFHEGSEPGQGAYWPELVRRDPTFDGTGIFLSGYHTDFDSHDYGFRDAANELHRSLKISIDPARDAVLDKPNILFVTHSAGGIVVRHMLTRHTGDFADKAVGLLLIASPSMGAEDADRLAFIADWVRSEQGHELSLDSTLLRELDKDFKNLVYRKDIPGLSGAEWLEHRLVYSRYFGIARDEVLVGSESGGRYFGEPVRLRDTDHISIVKPSGRDHETYRAFQYFYETDFMPSALHRDKQLGVLAENVEKPIKPSLSTVIYLSRDRAPIRIDEERTASLCNDLVTLKLTNVGKRHSGKPEGTVTVSSNAIDESRVTMEIGQSLGLTNDCHATLVYTGRDRGYYAIFEQ